MSKSIESTHHAHASQEAYSRTLLGFWIYILTDCVLFASIFATYSVLHNSTYGGPCAKELFTPAFALTETLILLTSSFTCALAGQFTRPDQKNKIFFWFAVTFLLGVAFLSMEAIEFSTLVQEGHDWQKSAFLSSFFTLVGTHGAHISAGLVWILVLMAQLWTRGLTFTILRRLKCLSLFWHFLDIVWIFIYTVVYLMGAI